MQDSVEETNPVMEVDAEKGVTDNDGSSEENVVLTKKKTELLRKHTSMQSSVLRFKNVDFAVGSNENKKLILDNVSGTVKWGRVLAIMGPSGAGKTTLISALTLDAHFGKASGSVTLNQVPLTGPIFKKHCFVVKQQDKHWPYLTLKETLTYAAGLYDVSDSRENTAIVVDEIIEKMGLNGCADTRCARLSGGQQRRLSIAVALLKQPTVLFLDEPTSGLDAAAASNIMQEITRVAKDEQLVIVCTIHQPSTKVYNGFDQVMILSRGREAFMGDVGDAAPYFESIGHPMPEHTNPAEHFLDLVNSDFSGEEGVTKILDQWAGTQGANPSTHGANPSTHDSNKNGGSDDDNVGADRVDDMHDTSAVKEVSIMFSRHFTLISRDPILYLGRCGIFLISCSVFAFVYWNAREFEKDQIFNKMWVQVWFAGVPTNMGVVAVYALNDEFKSIQRESQNGMISAGSYVFVKSLLTLPILFLFALFALLIPNYVIQDVPWSAFGLTIILYAAMLFVYESVAEALSVLFENPILGMLQFMNFWFAGFLFGGFLISEDSLIWPFRCFFYIMPFGPYLRSTMYVTISESDWSGSGYTTDEIFEELHKVYPLIENKDRVVEDIGILVAIGCFYKILYIIAIYVNTSKVANISP